MKRILISFVSMVDPFTIENERKRDGSLTHILRHYKRENKIIDEVYIYYSKEMVAYEDQINLAVKHFFPEINIKNLPENKEELRIDVNKYSTFYPIIFEKIKKDYRYEKFCEIIINISSGTPAMQTDLSLIAITNSLPENFKIKMLQVNSPAKQANRSRESYNEEELKEKLKEVDEEENKNNDRIEEEKINDTKKLILIESIKNSLEKDDYAGIYEVVQNNKDMFKDKNLLHYRKKLYYRNIGDEDNAKKDIPNELLNKLHIIKDKDFDSIVERMNILKTKEKRDEINDWLLLAQTVIEDLYEKMIEKFSEFKIQDILNEDKISLEKFEDLNKNQKDKYKNFFEIIKQNNGKFANAYVLKSILDKCDMKPEDKKTVTVLDKIREFRNVSAHKELLTRKKLNYRFSKKIEEEARHQNIDKKRLAQYPDDAIKEVKYKIKNILEEVVPEKDKPNMNEALNKYENIKKDIREILDKEMN